MTQLQGQIDIFGNVADGEEQYRAFTDKFKPARTTDDCYTPANIYEAIADWVAGEYALDRTRFVRPFYPGGDYERFDYPDGCVVVDNPPFSLLAKIFRFYLYRGVRFFLFAPTLTLFTAKGADVTYIPVGVSITYENGADVNTSFVTNLDTFRVRSAPSLYRAVKRANDQNLRVLRKQLPKYSYPPHVLTSAAAYQYSHYGVDYALKKGDCVLIDALDAQRQAGKAIFGKGFLLSERAAAERAAAERAAAERAAATAWPLSERERAMIARLGGETP